MDKLKDVYYSNDIFKDEIDISILFNDYPREPIKNHITLDKLFDGHYHSKKVKVILIMLNLLNFLLIIYILLKKLNIII